VYPLIHIIVIFIRNVMFNVIINIKEMSAILLHCTNQISNTQSQCLVKAALLCPVSDSHGLLNHPRGIMCHVVYCYYCMHPIYPRIKSNGVMQIC